MKSSFPYLVDISVGDFCPFGCPMCVVPDSLILSERGQIPIKDIKTGDKIYSFDILNKNRNLDIVSNVFERDINEDIYEITLENGKKLLLTKEHPVFVDNQWVSAEQLKINDDVLTF